MKLHAHLVAATVGLLTLVGGSAVTAASAELRAVVPFAFTAGKATLEAGSYTIDRTSSRGVVIMRSRQGGVIFQARPGEPATAGKSTRLVFHRYGTRYFLRQVWFDGTSGYGLPESREERDSANRGRERALGPSVVVIGASLG